MQIMWHDLLALRTSTHRSEIVWCLSQSWLCLKFEKQGSWVNDVALTKRSNRRMIHEELHHAWVEPAFTRRLYLCRERRTSHAEAANDWNFIRISLSFYHRDHLMPQTGSNFDFLHSDGNFKFIQAQDSSSHVMTFKCNCSYIVQGKLLTQS